MIVLFLKNGPSAGVRKLGVLDSSPALAGANAASETVFSLIFAKLDFGEGIIAPDFVPTTSIGLLDGVGPKLVSA